MPQTGGSEVPLNIQKTTFFISRPTGTPTNNKGNVNNEAFMELRTPHVPSSHAPLFSEEGIKGYGLKQGQGQKQKQKQKQRQRQKQK